VRRRHLSGAQTIRDVVEDFLVNKTIFFIGDSINGQVYKAAVRASAARRPTCAG
jgi:hypothetical protein